MNLPPPGATYSGSWPGSVWQDLRYSARTLRGSPVFSLTVLLAVALSIGPLTAILSVGNWLLWRPHPGVTDSRSIAMVWFMEWRGNGGSPSGVSYENLEDIRTRARTFTGIAGVQESRSSLAVQGRLPAQTSTAIVTSNFFDVLGVRLRAGRSFTPDEDRGQFGAPVVVISHRLAHSAFGSPEAALGKSIALNSRPFSIIGVADPAFGGISQTGGVDAWLTGATWPYLNHAKPRSSSREDGIFYEFVVRKAPTATFVEVESELKVLARRLADSSPADNKKFVTRRPASISRPRLDASGACPNNDDGQYPAGRRHRAAAARVRQCREPSGLSCGSTRARDRRPQGARCIPRQVGAVADDGELAGFPWRSGVGTYAGRIPQTGHRAALVSEPTGDAFRRADGHASARGSRCPSP